MNAGTADAAAAAKVEGGRMGSFWWEGSLCLKKETRLQRIVSYFDDACLKQVLLPIIMKDGELSLRALDWLVTNYSKKVPIVYTVTPPGKPQTLFNLHREYKDWLRNHKRKNFDPFRRGQRIYFDVDGQTYESTVGQLNFFFWASRYGVLDYARANIQKIEKDQAAATKHHNLARQGGHGGQGQVGAKAEEVREPQKKKRRQLSQAPKESVFVYPATIRVVFNPELGEPTF
jgi:hypothetical protein